MNSRFRSPLLMMLLSLCVLAAGCATKAKVKGKLVKDGQPFTVSDKGVIQMTFYAESDSAKAVPYPVDTKVDGTFEVMGKERKGIPAGKYFVVIRAIDPYPGEDLLKGKFAPEKTALTQEVKGNDEITIDVAK